MDIDSETIKRIEQLGEQVGRMIGSAFVQVLPHTDFCDCHGLTPVVLNGRLICSRCHCAILCEICDDDNVATRTHIDYAVCDSAECWSTAINNVASRH